MYFPQQLFFMEAGGNQAPERENNFPKAAQSACGMHALNIYWAPTVCNPYYVVGAKKTVVNRPKMTTVLLRSCIIAEMFIKTY